MFIPFRTADSPLEVLRIAEANLSDSDAPFEFQEWSRCSCGHIYSATYKTTPPRRVPTGFMVLMGLGGLYRRTLDLICEAHKIDVDALRMGTWRELDAMRAVSNLTASTSGSKRENALRIVRTTIAYELERQEADRMRILRSLGELDAGPSEIDARDTAEGRA